VCSVSRVLWTGGEGLGEGVWDDRWLEGHGSTLFASLFPPKNKLAPGSTSKFGGLLLSRKLCRLDLRSPAVVERRPFHGMMRGQS
jgi:hypothetical protein